jgi:hypothetical protein
VHSRRFPFVLESISHSGANAQTAPHSKKCHALCG